jgi:hypothetical protein
MWKRSGREKNDFFHEETLQKTHTAGGGEGKAKKRVETKWLKKERER